MKIPSDYKKRLPNILFLSVLVTVGVGMMFWLNPKKTFVHPHIRADRFVWPKGCQKRDYAHQVKYGGSDRVPLECANEKYVFNDADKYGFGWYGKGLRKYYRIGNDVVLLACHTVFHYCIATDAVEDVFYQ